MRVAILCVAISAGLAGERSAAADLCTARRAEIAVRTLASKTCAALAAINAQDRPALSAFVAEDFVMTAASGQFLPRAREILLDKWTAPPPPGGNAYAALIEVHSERLDGRAGAISGVIEDRTASPSGVDCIRHAFTDIWVRREKRWYWVQSHESGVTPCPLRNAK